MASVSRVPSPPSQSRLFTFTPRLELNSASQSERALAAEMLESFLPQDGTFRSLRRMDSRHLCRLPHADARMLLIISQNGPLQSMSPSSSYSSSSSSPSLPSSIHFCFNNLGFSLHSRLHFVQSLHFPLSEAAASCFPVRLHRLFFKVSTL